MANGKSNNDKSRHIPVLLNEVILYLNPKAGKNYVDATLGGGGHAKYILDETGPDGMVMGFDLDPQAIEATKKNLNKFSDRVIYINENYSKLKVKINEHKFNKISGIICDLGYSSLQMESGDRGFSYHDQAPFDLRYSPNTKLTASDIVNNFKEEELLKIFKEYGEEPLAKRIAKQIVTIRKSEKINIENLNSLIARIYAKQWHSRSKRHPATRIWQALRIAVNQEFDNLRYFLPQALDSLQSGGRLVVISFHSGEDRIVKIFFREKSKVCICPSDIPQCICQHKSEIKIITKKPIIPSEEEIKLNPRARSAKLRVVEKV